jgi:Fe-S cluster biogenesis protein NfuA
MPNVESIESALHELLPAMVADGGGAKLLSVDGGTAIVGLVGTCTFCPSRQLSADALARGLQERVPDLTEITIFYPSLRNDSDLVCIEGIATSKTIT